MSQPGSIGFREGDVAARLNQLGEGMSRFGSVCFGRGQRIKNPAGALRLFDG
ncbi:Uncharacterised protein [Arachnia propionica]|nr:Uncharacterised protein [Arachnia propionica]